MCSKKRKIEELVEDKLCITTTSKEINWATVRMTDYIIETPCEKSHLLDDMNMDIMLYMKKEFRQITGSFKARGALYALLKLPDTQKRKGVITASMVNHALALCYYGDKLEIPVTVVLPKTTPITTIITYQRYHFTTVHVDGENLEESLHIAMKEASYGKLHYIDGYDDPNLIIGQGTIGTESKWIISTRWCVPCDGGGLLLSVALAIKQTNPWVEIYGVEAEKYTSFKKAFNEKQMSYSPLKVKTADVLAVPRVGSIAFNTIINEQKKLIKDVFIVKDEWIAKAIVELFEKEHCIVDSVGAIGLAAILSGKLKEKLSKKRVVVLLGSGNIDIAVLPKCLQQGLIYQGRLVKFTQQTTDLQGRKEEICRLLTKLNVSIMSITHESNWRMLNDTLIEYFDIRIICEIKNWNKPSSSKKFSRSNVRKDSI